VGSNPDAKNSENETALRVAVGGVGGIDLVSMLLQAGANPNLAVRSWSPLMTASANGQLGILKLLIESGASVNLRVGGNSAIHLIGGMMAFADSEDIFRLIAADLPLCLLELIEHGADLYRANSAGNTGLAVVVEALGVASPQGAMSKEYLKLAYIFKVAQDLGDNGRLNVRLFWATTIDDPAQIEEALENGADLSAQTRDGNTALISAAQVNSLKVVKRLLVLGATKETRNVEGRTALMIASRAGYSAIVELLR
jgi:ankyrin repeat protein